MAKKIVVKNVQDSALVTAKLNKYFIICICSTFPIGLVVWCLLLDPEVAGSNLGKNIFLFSVRTTNQIISTEHILLAYEKMNISLLKHIFEMIKLS